MAAPPRGRAPSGKLFTAWRTSSGLMCDFYHGAQLDSVPFIRWISHWGHLPAVHPRNAAAGSKNRFQRSRSASWLVLRMGLSK